MKGNQFKPLSVPFVSFVNCSIVKRVLFHAKNNSVIDTFFCVAGTQHTVTQKLVILGRVSSPLCVNELRLECSQTQLCHIGVFIDCVEQLHVSAFIHALRKARNA